MTLTAERLRELLHYEPETGLFRWRVQRAQMEAGSIAGTPHLGYTQIRIDERVYRAHRLAWLYMTGRWPEAMIDHANGVRGDDRWSNLREATKSQNNANSVVRLQNALGLKGVQRVRSGRYRAKIKRGGVQTYLGTFDTPQEAAAVYASAAVEAFGQFARPSISLEHAREGDTP